METPSLGADPEEHGDEPLTDARLIECDQKPLSCTLETRLRIREFAQVRLPKMGPILTLLEDGIQGRKLVGRSAVTDEWPGQWRKLHASFHEKLEYLTQLDRGSVTEASAWRMVTIGLQQAEHEGEIQSKRQAWPLEEGRAIVWTPKGISLKIDRGDREIELAVIAGFLKPERSVVVEGWTYFEVLLTPGQRVIASAEDLLKRLERDGRIRKKKLGHDVLVEVLHRMAPDAGAAFPVYGIFADPSGQLAICRSPVPVREEQALAHEELETGLTYQAVGDDLRAYFEFASHFDPYEFFPAMGLSAVGPVAHTLRGNDIFVPHIWHYSLAHGLGKSLVALAFSRQLWGRTPTTGSAINSEFRLSAHLDASAAPQCVEEGENLNLQRLAPDIKTSAERPIVSRRGSTMLTMVPYSSRCSLFVSGNRLAPRSGPTLSRFLAPRFNSGRLVERRERKAEMDAVFGRLRPVGHVLAEAIAQDHPSVSSLLLRIRDAEQAIAATGAAQGDIRRAQMWAVVYVGLEAWARAAANLGVEWSPPPLPEFVARVVVPVDQSTYESEETVVDAFRSWFEIWRTRNVTKVQTIHVAAGRGGRDEFERTEEVRGSGQLFEDGSFQVDPTKKIPGYWITQPLVSEYNRQAVSDLNIGSLKELAVASADQAGISHDLVLDKAGGVRRADFPGKRVRAAFVARDREPGLAEGGE
jgi:hypothetical protein